jgi:hypothetical protein
MVARMTEWVEFAIALGIIFGITHCAAKTINESEKTIRYKACVEKAVDVEKCKEWL